MKKIKPKEPIYELLETLYFCEGLEDLPYIWMLKPKYMREWSETTGRKLKDIFFALINEQDPEFIIKKLKATPLKNKNK